MPHGQPRPCLEEGGTAVRTPVVCPALRPESAHPAPGMRPAAARARWVCRQIVSCQPEPGLAARAAREFSGADPAGVGTCWCWPMMLR